MTFDQFKNGQPAQSMFRKLGLAEHLDAASSWRALRSLIVDFNQCDQGKFVELVKRCDGVCSSGERILLHAICYACDFAWLADQLQTGSRNKSGRGVWQNMDRASGEFGCAVAACIEGVAL